MSVDKQRPPQVYYFVLPGIQSYDAKGAKFNRSYVPDVTNNCSVPIYEEILEMSASIKKEENLKKGSSFGKYNETPSPFS